MYPLIMNNPFLTIRSIYYPEISITLFTKRALLTRDSYAKLENGVVYSPSKKQIHTFARLMFHRHVLVEQLRIPELSIRDIVTMKTTLYTSMGPELIKSYEENISALWEKHIEASLESVIIPELPDGKLYARHFPRNVYIKFCSELCRLNQIETGPYGVAKLLKMSYYPISKFWDGSMDKVPVQFLERINHIKEVSNG